MGTYYEQYHAPKTKGQLTFSIKSQIVNILGCAFNTATLSQLLNSVLVAQKQPETIKLELPKQAGFDPWTIVCQPQPQSLYFMERRPKRLGTKKLIRKL